MKAGESNETALTVKEITFCGECPYGQISGGFACLHGLYAEHSEPRQFNFRHPAYGHRCFPPTPPDWCPLRSRAITLLVK